MFTDRSQAGVLLAEKLPPQKGSGSYVLGLARGGVVVASRLASKLSILVDVLVVKKIPTPDQPELGLGAVAPDGVFHVNWRLVQARGIDEAYIRTQISELSGKIRQKILMYRKGRKPLVVRHKTIILVDDGAATGATFEAAVKWCKAKKAKNIIAALPVTSREAASRIRPEVDMLVTLEEPKEFDAVGQYYREFPQVTDEEVIELLDT